jgi:hypothetical protein
MFARWAVLAVGDSCVIDENVEPAERRFEIGCCCSEGLWIAEIDADAVHLQTFAAQGTGRLITLPQIAGTQDDPNSRFRQLPGYLETDAFVGPSDLCDASRRSRSFRESEGHCLSSEAK